MHLIIGLGNPGLEYGRTKHNLGFMVVEAYAQAQNFPAFAPQAKFQSLLSRQGEVLLAKPQTYMNRSGSAVAALVNMYKGSTLWVVHDDLDLELGNWKIQTGTGPKIHNGLLSIYQELGAKDFWHVRVGVDTRQGDRTIPSEKYVLMPFTDQENQLVDQVINDVTQELIRRTT